MITAIVITMICITLILGILMLYICATDSTSECPVLAGLFPIIFSIFLMFIPVNYTETIPANKIEQYRKINDAYFCVVSTKYGALTYTDMSICNAKDDKIQAIFNYNVFHMGRLFSGYAIGE